MSLILPVGRRKKSKPVKVTAEMIQSVMFYTPRQNDLASYTQGLPK